MKSAKLSSTDSVPGHAAMRAEIERQVEQMLAKYEAEPAHVRQVAGLADQLFLSLRRWHGMDEREREWLQASALLHDTGWSLSPTGEGHHKHSARLIREWPWQGWSRRVIMLISLVARYHRKALPSARDRRYVELPPGDQKLVCLLAGMLRVADALDRTHTQAVSSVHVDLDLDEMVVVVASARACEEEFAAVEKKKDLLEAVSGRRVVVRRKSTRGH